MTRSNPSPRAKAVTKVYWNYVPKPEISPPIQQKHLYTPIWTPTHDQCFIDALWDKVMVGCSDVESFNNKEAIKYATTMVNLIMKEAFTVDANYGRYIKLRERFEMFSYLIHNPRYTGTDGKTRCMLQLNFGNLCLSLFRVPNSTMATTHEGCAHCGISKDVCHTELGRVDEDATKKLLMWMQSLSYRWGRMITEIVGLLGSKS
ncbi:hypothetical protein Salat_0662900 [Sesamum alatum]|uniref:Myb/SANT-like domain-containing protein n=1 Tax=Sesamum alatum TaxID=300844 RepID=A0AAE1YR44_9LAMI|nr:hypothetical protein Salat_0662900 [Sesamum alatum]